MNGTLQTTKTRASLRPQWKTVKWETPKEMAGARNRSLGLLLEKEKNKKGMLMMMMTTRRR